MSEPAENDLSQSGSDETCRHFVYDDKWRIVATVIEGDDDAKESFVWHNAGLGGMGGSSYIDACVLRDRDHDTGWDTASDGVLERRDYYVQNWRADVVALLTDLGKQVEHIRYSAYGEPFGIRPLDSNSDGTVSTGEQNEFSNAQTSGTPYHILYDTDLDGDVDLSDPWPGSTSTLGYGTLSGVSNRIGYAGYVFDDDITRFAHVRHRVYDTTLGRWTRRDPAGYVDGLNLLAYAQDEPLLLRDSSGLDSCSVCQVIAGTLLGGGCSAAGFALCGALGMAGGVPGLICGVIMGMICGGLTALTPNAICTALGYCSPTSVVPVDPITTTPGDPTVIPPEHTIPLITPHYGDCKLTTTTTPVPIGPGGDPCNCLSTWRANNAKCRACFGMDNDPSTFDFWGYDQVALQGCLDKSTTILNRCLMVHGCDPYHELDRPTHWEPWELQPNERVPAITLPPSMRWPDAGGTAVR